MSAEPSMEEILSSIKRIIAEEGDGPAGRRRTQRPASPPPPSRAGAEDDANGVLELSDPMPDRPSEPAAPTSAVMDLPVPENTFEEPAAERDPFIRAAGPEPVAAAGPEFTSPGPGPDPAPEPAKAASILSPRTAEVSRSALDTLSRIVVKPETGSDGTLESLVREMLRPMLRDWLDANLPAMVETMVQAEIARITGRRD